MSLLVALAQAVESTDPVTKLRPLAGYVRTEDLLLFVLDREMAAFLPPPGVLQTLPHGAAWAKFLQECDPDSNATLTSPYNGEATPVWGRKIGSGLIAAALGREPDPEKWDELCAAAPLLLALFESAHYAQIATAQAQIAAESAQEANVLAWSLLNTRRKLESALALAEERRLHAEEVNQRFRLAQDLALMGIWEWDIPAGRVRMSDELYRIHGMEIGTFGGGLDDIWDLFHPDDRARIRAALNAAVADACPYDLEFRIICPDGTTKWVSVRGKVDRDDKGTPVRMLGFTMDITQKKAAEEVLARTERLATAGRLSATIAHEINNPLESVINLLYLIAADSSLKGSTRGYLQMAEREIARVSHIARQTLAFYRDTSSPAPVDLSELLNEVIDLYSSQLVQNDILVIRDFRATKPIVGFRGELKQLFANLLSNALEAMSRGGELRIAIRETEDGVEITVSDSGVGIEPDILPRLFEPFFTTKQHTGTGLGLWVSRGIAEKHGGNITVETMKDGPRHGTNFCVSLSAHAFLNNLSTAADR